MVRFGRAIALLGLVLAPSPALAQIDLSGSWSARYHEDFPERIPGPEIGDYLGLPINDAARLRGDSWDASLLTLPNTYEDLRVLELDEQGSTWTVRATSLIERTPRFDLFHVSAS